MIRAQRLFSVGGDDGDRANNAELYTSHSSVRVNTAESEGDIIHTEYPGAANTSRLHIQLGITEEGAWPDTVYKVSIIQDDPSQKSVLALPSGGWSFKRLFLNGSTALVPCLPDLRRQCFVQSPTSPGEKREAL